MIKGELSGAFSLFKEGTLLPEEDAATSLTVVIYNITNMAAYLH